VSNHNLLTGIIIGGFETVLWFYPEHVKISSFQGPRHDKLPLVEQRITHDKAISIAAKAMRNGVNVREMA
jgi:hypothetical protein